MKVNWDPTNKPHELHLMQAIEAINVNDDVVANLLDAVTQLQADNKKLKELINGGKKSKSSSSSGEGELPVQSDS